MKRLLPLLLAATFLGALPAAAQVPEIAFDSAANPLSLPDDVYLGEAAGVATNSKGDIFVYTRTGHPTLTIGAARGFVHGGSRLFQFDRNGKFVREIGKDSYAFVFAQQVRIDPQDNIWIVDQMTNTVLKFDPEGRVLMILGRKPEAVTVPVRAPAAPAAGQVAGAGAPTDIFNRPTDVAWDGAGNTYVADGVGNQRVAKFDKNGVFIKSWGSRGTEPGQFNTPHTLATDAQGNVYVGDRGNRRIQVFDNGGEFKKAYLNVGAPWAVCISPGPHQYLFSSNSNGTSDMENGEIYKMELDGRILGKFGTAGKLLKEFGSIHEIDCRNPNEILVGEITNWRVQKLTLHAIPSGTR